MAASHLIPCARKIETQVAKSVNEHLIIYTDAASTQQVWQWVKRETGQADRGPRADLLPRPDRRGADPEAAGDRLQPGGRRNSLHHRGCGGTGAARASMWSGSPSASTSGSRPSTPPSSSSCSGIPDEAAAALVRLGDAQPADVHLLHPEEGLPGRRSRLPADPAGGQPGGRGADRFYARLPLPAVLRGLCQAAGASARPQTEPLLGQVPYLNGGIFERHQIEKRLRRRPSRSPMPPSSGSSTSSTRTTGTWTSARCAPTTRSTPTCWATSSRSTSTRSRWGPTTPRRTSPSTSARTRSSPSCSTRRATELPASPSRATAAVWRLLRDDPDRYIYAAVRHGVDAAAARRDRRRGGRRGRSATEWNRPAPAEYALPTEIWREVVARRQRYEEVRGQAGGRRGPRTSTTSSPTTWTSASSPRM